MTPVCTQSVASNAGGLHETPPQGFVRANGNLVSVQGTPIESHTDFEPPHTNAFTDNAGSFWKINGIRVSRNGDAATCGHPNENGLSWLTAD